MLYAQNYACPMCKLLITFCILVFSKSLLNTLADKTQSVQFLALQRHQQNTLSNLDHREELQHSNLLAMSSTIVNNLSHYSEFK